MADAERRHLNAPWASSEDYDFDPQGQFLYWDYVHGTARLLTPARRILDPHIAIGKVGQQNLLPTHLSLKPKDLELTPVTDESGIPIGDPVPPGISAFLFFGSPSARQDSIHAISESHLGKDAHWKNRSYVTQVEDVVRAGWVPFYVPLINKVYKVYNPLHVLLVPGSILQSGQLADATEQEKHALAQSFVRWDF